ncbi:S-adenosyl-L-methionine-dependent methyltransferase [Phascolomyces articulosus]|uniref:Cytosine-specific methyltransferase n=1 Tax=Phascolomyces articulosus TaxID=60185 RepID=A0AAD5JN53_9FUNG|nr:S-adenosyl-L-methionine-dependent methyltransferase [Phascolomyces articulosus]
MTSAIRKRAKNIDANNVKLLRKKFASISNDTIRYILRECENDLNRAEIYLKEQGKKKEQKGGVKRAGSESDNEEEVQKKRKTDDTSYFTPPTDLIVEDEFLEVIGEQDIQEDDENEVESYDDDKRPMRTLSNFCLYDLNNNNQYASIDDIGQGGMDVVAFGDVAAIYVDDSDDENDDDDDDDNENGSGKQQHPATTETANVQLSAIFYWQVHINDDVPELWLLTSYGWYKLMRPMETYSSLYLPIFARTMIAGMAEAELMENPKITYKKFIEKLEETPNMLDLTITSTDVEENADYLHQELDAWAAETGFDPAKSSLIKQLSKLSGSATEYSPSNVMTVRGSAKQQSKKKTYEVTSEPCVTSHIASVSKDMFVRHLHAIQDAANEVEKNAQTHNNISKKKEIYKNQTKNVQWQGESVAEENGMIHHEAAIVDGEVIKVNDYVYLRTGMDTEPWFARVMSMYETQDGNKMFHARFFSHGKETILDELAGERELFLLDDYAENHLESVMGKCNVQHLDADQREPAVFHSKDYWYYRLWYDPHTAVFEDARLHENEKPSSPSCINKVFTNAENTVTWDDDKLGFRYQNKEYHLHDYAYLLTGPIEEPYDIGQILEINKKEDTVKVQFLERKDTNILNHGNMLLNGSSEPFKDNRSLGYIDEQKTVEISLLEGTCNVVARSSISDLIAFKKQSPNNFYVKELKGDQCKKCKEAKEKKEQKMKEFMATPNKKLVALDIFGGCGGLTCGMELTGVVDTRYAIEFNSSAVVSFERNFKGAKVYNKCANLLLRRAISQHSHGETLEAMEDELGRPLGDMPKPGEIDFIYCGPPCQGFSGMNRFKKPDDIKNTLVCTALSYVDFYKPSYFLLENVRGLVSYKLGAEKTPNGVLKYILRCLTSMGYQVRFGIHQAGNHGVAQSRRRLIVWGARIGKQLPDFPEPATCFSGTSSVTISVDNKNTGSKTTICYYNRTGNRAPLPAVTVGDTISDLPPFEYENTHHLLPDNGKNIQIRNKTVVKQLDGTVGMVGTEIQKYGNEAKTDFQADIRHGANMLHNHVTRSFSPLNIERVCNIPMRPGADHRDLPDALEPWCLSAKNPASARHDMWKGLYGRLDFEGRFQTQLTEMSPMGKQGTVLHPNQHRVMTVRECARVQGFPDSFVFDSANESPNARIKDMYRQIGNAVPVTLSFALGNCLKEALIKEHNKGKNQSS